MAIGLLELRTSAKRLSHVFRSPLLPIFALVTGFEAMLVLAMPGQATEVVGAMLGEPLLGVFGAYPAVFKTAGLIFALMLLDLLRTGMWGGLRAIAFQDEALTSTEILWRALFRVPKLLVTQQIIGVFVFLVSALCWIVGAPIQSVPHALVTFTLAPAIYAVVAMRRPIGFSLSQAVRITRYNLLAVFGLQSALLAMAYWIADFFQGVTVAPMVGSYAAITLLVTYRFASFAGMGTLFLALEDAGEFER